MSNKKKIGITGASGFIGKPLIDILISTSYEVYVLTRNPSKIDSFLNLKIIEGDFLDLDKTNAIQSLVKNVDVIYHLAAELKNEKTMQQINIDTTMFLAEMCAQNNVHLIFLSSIGIFDTQNDIYITEKNIPKPRNNYELSKFKAESKIKSVKNLNYTIIRPSTVLGLEMKSFIIKLLNRLISLPFKIDFKENIIANFILIEDLLKALLIAKDNKNCFKEDFNLSNDLPLVSFINFFGEKNKKIIVPFKLFLFGIQLLFKIRLLPISKEGILFFRNQSQISTEKIEAKLKFKCTGNYSKFLKAYLHE